MSFEKGWQTRSKWSIVAIECDIATWYQWLSLGSESPFIGVMCNPTVAIATKKGC